MAQTRSADPAEEQLDKRRLGIGIELYGLISIFPLYLSGIRGYDSLQISEAMMVSGIAMFLIAPTAALSTLTGMVQKQAVVMSLADLFVVLSMFFASLALLLLLVRKPAPGAGGGEAH